jgi:hypothetical protein
LPKTFPPSCATPSFAIEGPGSEGFQLLGTLETTGEIEEAIEKAS